jgi:hypothetical protein
VTLLALVPVTRLIGACDPASSRGAAALAELERLAFVPPDEVALPALDGPPIVCDNQRALLIDRFEVGRDEWRRWYVGQSGSKDPLLVDAMRDWAAESGDWPASFMNLDEARRFAASRGMRLLTACEWIRAACGPRRHPWPWGYNSQSSTANTLDLNLGRPVAMGTFEQGKSPQSICDLLGNVWEWVDEPIRATIDGAGSDAWAMGGSFLSQPRRTIELVEEFDAPTRRQIQRWAFHQQGLHPATRSSDVGLRCAVDAEEYLWQHAPRFESSDADAARLVEIGRAWGRGAVPLLETLVSRPSAPPALARLLSGARQ